MRKTALVVIPLIALMLAGAGRSRTPRRAVQRAPTPQDTLMRLKRAVARGDRAEEWRTLSPGLKQRISRRAGRNVDVADYITFRNSNRRDPQIRQAEKYLRGARVLRTYPYVEVIDHEGLTMAVVSYDDHLFFGLTADRDAMPDLGLLAAGIDEEFHALLDAAVAREA